MSKKFKEYEFEEWLMLSEDDKTEIINQYWNPYKPEIGQKTRREIIRNFEQKFSGQLDFCQFRYLGFYAIAIFVIPSNSNTRLPRTYSGLTINKGKVKQKIKSDLWIVKWNHSGTEELKMNESTVANSKS